MQFFQWTYFCGVLYVACTAKLKAREDLLIAYGVLTLSILFSLIDIRIGGLSSVWSVLPLGAWLASCSAILLRCLGQLNFNYQSRPYAVISAANAGAIFGAACGLAIDIDKRFDFFRWLTVAMLLLLGVFGVITYFFIQVRYFKLTKHEIRASSQMRVGNFGKPMIWVLLAAAPSAGLIFYGQVVKTHIGYYPAAGFILPLLAMLLAYCIGWSQGKIGSEDFGLHSRLVMHLAASFLLSIFVTTIFSTWHVGISIVAWYLFCALVVERLRALAPSPEYSSAFQFWQALGGAIGGWAAMIFMENFSESQEQLTLSG